MSASQHRPDPTSPTSIAEATFSTVRRGFNADEVRTFLVAVGAEIGRLRERERQLLAELAKARDEAKVPPEVDEETVARFLGEETTRVLTTARESAGLIKQHAEEASAELLGEANEEANRVRKEANEDAARQRQAGNEEYQALVASAKEEGREMVNEARAYRERVLADLEKRTKLAKAQVEELAQSRDRLLQVFQRARLVAVDVANELQRMDGPEQLVNLTPTTEPIPLMVPAERSQPGETVDGSTVPGAADAPAPSEAPPIGTDAADTSSLDPDAEASPTSEPAPLDAGSDNDTRDDGAAEDGGEPPTDGRDASDIDEEVSDADDEADDDEETDGVGGSTPNVVNLFPAAAVASADDDDVATDDEANVDEDDVDGGADRADDPVEASDDGDHDHDVDDSDGAAGDPVDSPAAGIFARLRDQVPDGEADLETGNADAAGEGAETFDGDESTDDTDDPFVQRDAALAPLLTTSARSLKRVLADEQNGVLAALRTVRAITKIDELLPAAPEQAASYVDAIRDELITASVAGARVFGADDSPTMRKSLVAAGSIADASQMIDDKLVGSLRQRLERTVASADGDNTSIAQSVRAIYREFKTQHIDDEIDDIFRSAYGRGMAVAVTPGTDLRWTIDQRHPACPDCEDNSLAGLVPAGEEYPTGHTAAPAHSGCRCLTLPEAE